MSFYCLYNRKKRNFIVLLLRKEGETALILFRVTHERGL